MRVSTTADAQKLLGKLNQASPRIRRGLEDWAYLAGITLQKEAAIRAPRRTGNLARSIQFELTGMAVRVGSDDPIAKIMEFGSRPHVIQPRSKRVLRFQSGGQVRFSRKVNHPGTRAYRFLRGALEAKQDYLSRLARSMVTEQLNG